MIDKHSQERLSVFICSPLHPLSADPEVAMIEMDHNIAIALQTCKLVTDMGMMPYCPHIYFPQWLDEFKDSEREREACPWDVNGCVKVTSAG